MAPQFEKAIRAFQTIVQYLLPIQYPNNNTNLMTGNKLEKQTI